ncbi:glycosyl transferase [Pectobacterium aroidearum]|uniref:Glycosyl transferase n=1 Tax=Pectobacterium aroidearum TaxID=1201031 RepID=A0ABR5ZH26_9GAMM|nr:MULTISPECIES: glycosyltransferase [Pectobacterium]MBA5201086.1 glycosyl transferase [Pectobacterium aroidearum]MBA5229394.1 glycosyl transferase [Pectobacterium aroidearum]MBA5233878.1 glycosyl transferase [Pectobacterium aroidearum]MBA5738991.1 glycosyl transferase [Pectobacterium aroidearum]UUE57548.1 glycosyl transferase [Pectobacterium aroidearum]
MKIPKKIHQIYTKGMHELPKEILASVEELKENNPDWEYFFYDEKSIIEYIDKHYEKEMLRLYLSIDPKYGAARADLFRYLLIYQEGGVYLDIKSSCSIPLNQVIKEDCEILLCSWDNQENGCDKNMGMHKELGFLQYGEYQQWNIIASPGSPYIKSAIDEVIHRLKTYKPWLYGVGMKGVLNTTGPIPFSLGIEKINKTEFFYHENNHRNIGLKYRNVAGDALGQLNKNHYSKLKDSIVILEGKDKLYYRLWLFFIYPLQRLKKNIINESKGIVRKIKRLLRKHSAWIQISHK